MQKQKGFLRPSDLAVILGNITVQGVYQTLKHNDIETTLIAPRIKVIPPLGVRKLLLKKEFLH